MHYMHYMNYINNNPGNGGGDGFSTTREIAYAMSKNGNGRGGWKDDGKIYNQWMCLGPLYTNYERLYGDGVGGIRTFSLVALQELRYVGPYFLHE